MAGLRIDIDTASAERASKALAQSMGALGHSAVGTEKDFKKLEDRMIKGMAADKATKNLKELQKSLKMTTVESAKLQASLGDFRGAFRTLNDGFDLSTKAADAMKVAFVGVGVSAAAATAVIAKSLQTFGQIEKGLIGVRKTTDMTDKQFASLTTTLEKMALKIPIAATDLLGIAEAAGQLGVKGAANIAKFTETMGKLQLSSDVVGDEGAKSIARLLTVTDTAIGTVDKFGSVLVRLGNSAAASESEILSMALEVGQATSEFAVSASQAAALGAAMKSLGISSEVGGSVVGRSMNMIAEAVAEGGEKLDYVAKTAGMTADALKKSFGQDSAAVFQKWIAGIGGMTSSTKTVAMLLKEFGIEGQEAIKVLGPMAGKSDLVGSSLATMNDELLKNTALNKEAAAASEAFDNQMILTKNAIDQISVIVGGAFAPDVLKIAEGFRDWTSANKGLIEANVNEYVGRLSETLRTHKDEILSAAQGWASFGGAAVSGIGKIASVTGGALGGATEYFSGLGSVFQLWQQGALDTGQAMKELTLGWGNTLGSFKEDFDLTFMEKELERAKAALEDTGGLLFGIVDESAIREAQEQVGWIEATIEHYKDTVASDKFLAAWDKQSAATGAWSDSASRDIDDVSGAVLALDKTLKLAGGTPPPDVAPTIHKMTDAVSRITKALEEEQWALGKTDEAILAHKLEQAGATPEEIKAAVAIQKTVDAHKKAAKASIDSEKKTAAAEKKALADRKAISRAYIKTYQDEEKAAQDRWQSEIEAMNAAIAEEKRIYDESLAFTMGPEYRESKTSDIDKLYGKRISAGVDESTALAQRAKELRDLYKEIEDHTRESSIEMAKSLDEPGGFFDAFTIGMQTMQDETKTWGEMGVDAAQEFSSGSKELLKSGLFGVIQNDMEGFSDAWEGMWKSMLGNVIDFISDAAFNDLAGLFGGSGSGSGMGLGGIVSGIGSMFGGGGTSGGGGFLSGIGDVVGGAVDWVGDLFARDGRWDILDDGTGRGPDGIPIVAHKNEMIVPAHAAPSVRGLMESVGITDFKQISGPIPVVEPDVIQGYYRNGAWDFLGDAKYNGISVASIAAGSAMAPVPAVDSREMRDYAAANGISDMDAFGGVVGGDRAGAVPGSSAASSAGFNAGFSKGFMGSISSFGGIKGSVSGFAGLAAGDFGARSALGALGSAKSAMGLSGRISQGGVAGLMGNISGALQSAGMAGITSGLMGAMGLSSKQAAVGSKLGQSIGMALGGPAVGAMGGMLGGIAGDAFGDMTDSREHEMEIDAFEDAFGFAGMSAHAAARAQLGLPSHIAMGVDQIQAAMSAKRAKRAAFGELGISTGTLSASAQAHIGYQNQIGAYNFGWEPMQRAIAAAIEKEAEDSAGPGGRGSGPGGTGSRGQAGHGTGGGIGADVGASTGTGGGFGTGDGGVTGLATGGTAQAGETYIVGENGPEIFMPGVTGSVVPNGATNKYLQSLSAGGVGDSEITVTIDAPWMEELKKTGQAIVDVANAQIVMSEEGYDPEILAERYQIDPETDAGIAEVLEYFESASKEALETVAGDLGITMEMLAADMNRLQGAMDMSGAAAENRIDAESRLAERYGDVSTPEAQQGVLDIFGEMTPEQVKEYADNIGVSVTAITNDMGLLKNALAEGAAIDVGAGMEQIKAMMQGVDDYYEGIAKNSRIEQLRAIVTEHESLTEALEDTLATTEEKNKLEQAHLNELGASLTGLGQGGVADALWNAINSGASAAEFLGGIEENIKEKTARAVSDAVSESISSAFIAPINDAVGSMVTQIVSGGFTSGAAIKAGVAEIVKQMEAVSELMNSKEFQEGIDDLITSLAESTRDLRKEAIADMDERDKTAAALKDQLDEFMRGIDDQILEMGLNDIQLQYKQLNDAMQANIDRANELYASEEQLATIRGLGALKIDELTKNLTEQIEDAQASIMGADAIAKLKTQRASDLTEFDFFDDTVMQDAVNWFTTADPAAIGEYAVSIGADLGDIIDYVTFFADELGDAGDGILSATLKIQEAQSKLKGPEALEEFKLARISAKYDLELTGVEGRQTAVDWFQDTDPEKIEEYASSIGVSVDDLISDIFYLSDSLDTASSQTANTLAKILKIQHSIIDGADHELNSLARKYGIASGEFLSVSTDFINDFLSLSGDTIEQMIADQGAEEYEEYAKDVAAAFNLIEKSVSEARLVLKSAYQAEIETLQKELDVLNTALGTAKDDYLYYLGEEISAQQEIADAAKDASGELKDLSESMGEYLKSLGTEAATLSPVERYEAAGREWQEVVLATKSTDAEVSREAMGRLTSVSSNWLDASQEANALAGDYNADLAAVRAVLTTTQDVANLQAKKQDDIADAAEDQIDELENIVDEISGTIRAVDNMAAAADAYYAADLKLQGEGKDIEAKIEDYQAKIAGLTGAIVSLDEALASYTNALNIQSQIVIPSAPSTGPIAATVPNTPIQNPASQVASGFQSDAAALAGGGAAPIRDAAPTVASVLALKGWTPEVFTSWATNNIGDPGYIVDTLHGFGITDAKQVADAYNEGAGQAWFTGEDIKNALPGFANGGDFGGGLRIVGERGPEIEMTGPSRILNNNQTRDIFSGGNSTEVKEILAELKEIKLLLKGDPGSTTRRKLNRFIDGIEGGELAVNVKVAS